MQVHHTLVHTSHQMEWASLMESIQLGHLVLCFFRYIYRRRRRRCRIRPFSIKCFPSTCCFNVSLLSCLMYRAETREEDDDEGEKKGKILSPDSYGYIPIRLPIRSIMSHKHPRLKCMDKNVQTHILILELLYTI